MKRLSGIMFCIILFYAIPCHPQSVKEAVRALQKLQARVEAGISYRDYAPSLGDALFEAKLFLQGPEAKEKKELTETVNRAIGHYQTAGNLWSIKFSLKGHVKEVLVENYDDALIKMVFENYPEARDEFVGRRIKRDPKALATDRILIDDTVQIIWKYAARETDRAVSILAGN